MPERVRAKGELAVNIVMVIAALGLGGVVVWRYLFPQQVNRGSVQQQSQIGVGARMSVPNVDWEQNRKSLIFFLKMDCVHCESIAPFYRQLISEALKRNVKCLAILPNSTEEGRKYVQSLDLPIEDVQSGSPSSYKIPGAPTVLFVDHQGTVKSVWIGAVPGRERHMREELVALFDAEITPDSPLGTKE